MKFLLFLKEKALERFATFLETIEIYKVLEPEILFTISTFRMDACYHYRDAKNLDQLQELDPGNRPYMKFSYQFHALDGTDLETKNIIKCERVEKDKEINTITIQFSSKNMTKFCEFVVKTSKEFQKKMYFKLTRSNPNFPAETKISWLYLQANKEGENHMMTHTFIEVGCPKLIAKIPNIMDERSIRVFPQRADRLKLISEFFSKRNRHDKKYFGIITNGVKDTTFEVLFVWDTQCIFKLNYLKHEKGMIDFDSSEMYLVDIDQYVKLFKNLKTSIYKAGCTMIFCRNRIIFYFSAVNENLEKIYSTYSISIATERKNLAEAQDILAIY
jgi:hypothetical protein